MTDVFVSYSRGDREKVRVLAEELERAGLKVWWDSHLTTGHAFREEISEKLDEARLVIVVWSRLSVASRFVCDEADEGARRGALFPALIELVDIPLGFRQIQTADLTHWKGQRNDKALKAFIETVVEAATELSKQKKGSRPAPTPAPVPAEPEPARPVEPDTTPSSKPMSKSETRIQPKKARHTITGRTIRTKLLINSFFLAVLVAAGFGVLAYSADFVFPRFRPYLIGAVFVLTFLSRFASFRADKAMGSASMRLLSGSFVTLISVAALAIAPLVTEGRLYAGALQQVQIDGVEGADINGVTLSADGTTLATASDDGQARVWDARTGVGLGRFDKHENWVWSADFSPDGREVVTASRDRTVRVWSARSQKERLVLTGHAASVYDAKFSPDGTLIASASGDGTIRLWDAGSGDQLHVFAGHGDDVRSVSFSPDGVYLISGSADGTVRLWHVGRRAFQRTIGEGRSQWNEVAFDSSGRRIAGVSDGGSVRVWTVSGDSVLEASVPGKAFGVAFGGNDARIAVGSIDGVVRVFDIASGSLLLETSKHADAVRDVDGGPDGTIFVSGSRDNTARIWDAASGEEMQIVGHVEAAFNLPVVLDLPPVAMASRAPQPLDFLAKPQETALLLGKGVATGFSILFLGLLLKGIVGLTPAKGAARMITPALTSLGVLYYGALMLSALPLEAPMLWGTLAFIPATLLAFLRWMVAASVLRAS